MKERRKGWLAGLIRMALGTAALTAVLVGASLMLPAPGSYLLYQGAMWGLIPAMGGWLAFRTTRRGLSNYIAWAVPPICQTGAHWLLLGYPLQSLGMPLVSAGVCLVAAAAAQVLNERQEYVNRGGGKGKR